MNDLKKLFITHFLMLGLVWAVNLVHIHVINFNHIGLMLPLTGLIELILIITVSIKSNIKLKSVIIFFIIILLAMMLISVDSKYLYNDGSYPYLFTSKLTFPYELSIVLIIFTSTFQAIFVFLTKYHLLTYSCLIVPIYIIILAIFTISITKLLTYLKKKAKMSNKKGAVKK